MSILKEFQKVCLKFEEERKSKEFDKLMEDLMKEHEEKKILENWNILREAQERYGDKYRPVSVLGGLKKDKCPCCNNTLTNGVILVKGLYDYSIKYCPNCEYRFADAKRNGSN